MQSHSFVPASWGKVGLAILPGLFALGTSWVVETEGVIPTAGLGLCVLVGIWGMIRERRVPPWTLTAWGVFFSLLMHSIWLLVGFLGVLVLAVGLVWWTFHKYSIPFPKPAKMLLYMMILLGAIVGLCYGPWILFGGVAMLFVIATGLPLAKREGLSAGLFVVVVGFILWEETFDLTYGLWKTPWGMIMVAILALLLLVVSPVWVLRSRSVRGQVLGLLLPAAIALTSVAVINAVVRTDPAILERIVNFRAMFPGDQFIYGISGGSRGRENLGLLLFRDCMTAAQLFVGMVLTVVLYRWIGHRHQTTNVTQENMTTWNHRVAG